MTVCCCDGVRLVALQAAAAGLDCLYRCCDGVRLLLQRSQRWSRTAAVYNNRTVMLMSVLSIRANRIAVFAVC